MVICECGARTKVTDSRVHPELNAMWRKRRCLECGKERTTIEVECDTEYDRPDLVGKKKPKVSSPQIGDKERRAKRPVVAKVDKPVPVKEDKRPGWQRIADLKEQKELDRQEDF